MKSGDPCDGRPQPLNLGQRCLIDALLNPEISLVTCYGHAGTGKTLVAVAAGLHEMFNRRYNGITVSRPVVAMGEQLGFLPGSLDEKMRPWLQPIHDALDLLMRPATPLGPRRKQPKQEGAGGGPVKKPWEILMDQGIIEVEALCYIRGRSIPKSRCSPFAVARIRCRTRRGSSCCTTLESGICVVIGTTRRSGPASIITALFLAIPHRSATNSVCPGWLKPMA